MKELLIPYGKLADGIMVIPTDSRVSRGKNSNCFCPECECPLTAKRGNELQHHFAHNVDATCAGGRETSIHLMSKQIISEDKFLQLPDVIVDTKYGRKVLHRQDRTDLQQKLRNVRSEQRFHGFTPDIVAEYDGTVFGGSPSFARIGDEIFIEVAVTHYCDAAKKLKLENHGRAAIEIDISRESRVSSPSHLRQALRNAPREWIFHPMFKEIEQDLQRAREDYLRKIEMWEAKKRKEIEDREAEEDREWARQKRLNESVFFRALYGKPEPAVEQVKIPERKHLPPEYFSSTPHPLEIQRPSKVEQPTDPEPPPKPRESKPFEPWVDRTKWPKSGQYNYNDLDQRAAMERLIMQPLSKK